MRELGDDAGDNRRTKPVELVRNAVVDRCPYPGKAEQDFLGAFCRRVTFVRRPDIAGEQRVDARKLMREAADDLRGRRGDARLGNIVSARR